MKDMRSFYFFIFSISILFSCAPEKPILYFEEPVEQVFEINIKRDTIIESAKGILVHLPKGFCENCEGESLTL